LEHVQFLPAIIDDHMFVADVTVNSVEIRGQSQGFYFKLNNPLSFHPTYRSLTEHSGCPPTHQPISAQNGERKGRVFHRSSGAIRNTDNHALAILEYLGLLSLSIQQLDTGNLDGRILCKPLL
jgi:hypothetical protein